MAALPYWLAMTTEVETDVPMVSVGLPLRKGAEGRE